jgi:two-component system, cell cycle sensor histidine kinase and response regulator CckA
MPSKRDPEQLDVAERRLRAVLDAALDAVIGMDASDVITYWNPRAEAIFGWSREEALGKGLRDLIIPERYREAHTRGMAHFLATGEGPVLDRRIEISGLRRDGTEFPIELSITALKEGGTYTFSAFVGDITERKRAEAELIRYADVFRNTQVGINIWCLQDREDLRTFKLVSTNPAAAHSLGVRTEDVVGKRMDEAFPHMLDTELPALYRDVIVSGEGRDLGEVREIYGERATQGVFSAKVFPLPGDCVGVAFENITERRRLEEQLRQAQRLEAVGSLAGGIAHDFNNLLSVILGQSEFLLRGAGTGDRDRRRVEEIREAGQRAALLTRQLLAFSRKQVLIAEVLDPAVVIHDLATMLRRLIGEDVVLETAVRPETGAVKADRGQIEQVIVSLVVNARDAMPEGGVIRVEAENVDLDADASRHPAIPAGPYVRVTVSDTGVGMDPVTRSHAFEPFFTTKEQGKGTGLGLATVYGIVKQSGGYVVLHSEPGKGATFEIYLPRLQEVAAAGAAVAGPAPPPRPGTETILLVEDEEMLRELAREVLEAGGYRVLGAAGGEEAVRVAAGHDGTIHLLLTDVVMPGMNGRMLAERLLKSRPGMKVLYTSGYTDDVIFQRGVLPEGSAFLHKPFTTHGLERKVRDILDS